MKLVINAMSTKPGGGLTVLSTLLRAWRRLGSGLDISVLASNRRTIAALERLGYADRVVPLLVDSSPWRFYYWELFSLPGLMRELRADILLRSNHYQFNVPCPQVVLHQNAWRFGPPQPAIRPAGGLAERMRDWSARKALQSADANIFVSKYLRNLAELNYPASAPRNFVVYNGIDDEVFDESARRGDLYEQTPQLVAVQDGNIQKDNATLVRILHHLVRRAPDVDWRLKVAGGTGMGRFADDYCELARNLGVDDRIEWLGFCEQEILNELIRNSLCLVFTSVVEGFGLPPLEAMARRCPAVACNVTAMPEIIGDAGLLVPPRRADHFAESVIRLYRDRALRSKLVDKGFQRAKQFRASAAAAEFCRIFQHVAGGSVASRDSIDIEMDRPQNVFAQGKRAATVPGEAAMLGASEQEADNHQCEDVKGRAQSICDEQLRAIHLISDLTRTGGPSNSVPELCNSLVEAGVDTRLYTLRCGPLNAGAFLFDFREFPPTWPHSMSASRDMYDALREAVREPIVLHSHSMWTMPCVYPAWVVRGSQARAINSPRGTLAPWAFRWHRWRKAPFWWLTQRRALQAYACLHATSQQEFIDIRKLGLRNPVAIIPNAISMPESIDRVPPDSARPRRVLFMGRLHPVKGIDRLLHAWRMVQDQFPDWELQVVGPDDVNGYRNTMERLAAELRCLRASFLPPVYGAEKADAFRRADLFVLPSHTENFGLVVAEALSHGVPALVCKGAPWAGLEQHDCGWWVDLDPKAIAVGLRQALSLSDADLRAKGINGRTWVESQFSHRRVALLMQETYKWILGGGPHPDWVQL